MICQGPGCETTLPPHAGRGRPKKYCSNKCGRKAYKQRVHEEKVEELRERPWGTCKREGCDTPLSDSRLGRFRESCSKGCRQKAYEQRVHEKTLQELRESNTTRPEARLKIAGEDLLLQGHEAHAALAPHRAAMRKGCERFELEWEFHDHPTGL